MAFHRNPPNEYCVFGCVALKSQLIFEFILFRSHESVDQRQWTTLFRNENETICYLFLFLKSDIPSTMHRGQANTG